MHFVKISRLINLYVIIIIVIHKNAKKKHYINIVFHNFKIKCAQIKTNLTYQNGKF